MFFTYINRGHRSAIPGLEIAHAWVWQKTAATVMTSPYLNRPLLSLGVALAAPTRPRPRSGPVDFFTYEAARDALREIIDKVWSYCEGSGTRGRTVTLKVKFANFQIITRSRTGPVPVRTRGELEELSNALLEPLFPVARGIRLLGISMSSLSAEEAEQPGRLLENCVEDRYQIAGR